MTATPVLRNGPDARGGPQPTCAVCGLTCSRPRQTYCSDACRQAAFRRRRSGLPAILVPAPRHLVVYECPECETRYLGTQRCPDCGTFCRLIGWGGACPHCDEPVALADLEAQ